jgi:hypothetical protein
MQLHRPVILSWIHLVSFTHYFFPTGWRQYDMALPILTTCDLFLLSVFSRILSFQAKAPAPTSSISSNREIDVCLPKLRSSSLLRPRLNGKSLLHGEARVQLSSSTQSSQSPYRRHEKQLFHQQAKVAWRIGDLDPRLALDASVLVSCTRVRRVLLLPCSR